VVQVSACGICGTDVRYVRLGGLAGPTGQPMALGHEVSGVVEAVGAEVSSLAPGTRVVLNPTARGNMIGNGGSEGGFAQRLLVRDAAAGESLFADKYFPAPDPPGEQGDILTQTVAQGVDDPWESCRRAHMVAIANARHHAWIQSPYFVPDQGLYDVMINAALGGIDIQLMMPGKWLDKGLPYHAAQSYFKDFLQAGGRIFIYQDGFLHSKTLSVDSKVLPIGTMNLDIRALQLHKELMVWIYNEELTRQHEAIFAHDRERSVEITLLDVEGWTKWQNFRNSAARLASNLL
jgi:cardiolipin synthase